MTSTEPVLLALLDFASVTPQRRRGGQLYIHSGDVDGWYIRGGEKASTMGWEPDTRYDVGVKDGSGGTKTVRQVCDTIRETDIDVVDSDRAQMHGSAHGHVRREGEGVCAMWGWC
jgi:hypothetical protein